MLSYSHVMHFNRDFFDLLKQLFRVYHWRALNPLLISQAKAYSNFERKFVAAPSLAARPVAFPEDDLPHGTALEWWHVNARFKTSEGYPYAMHYTFVLLNLRDAHVSRRLKRAKVIPIIFFSLINLSRKTIQRNARCHTIVSAPDQPTFPLTIQTDADRFTILGNDAFSFTHEKLAIDLISKTLPLFPNDTGFVDIPSGPSLCAAYPQLGLQGSMRLYDRTLNIKGTAWLDHGWSNDVHHPTESVCFSIKFENGMDLIVSERERKGRKQFATMRLINGVQFSTEQASVMPRERLFKSRASGLRYPMDWEITIPELDLRLVAKAPFENAEMTFGFSHYWEGPIEVAAEMQGQTLTGLGFVRIVKLPLGLDAELDLR